MMPAKKFYRSKIAPATLAAIIIFLAFGKIHFQVAATLIGYEIGRLKLREGELMEKKSLLNMQLSQLTSKRHLELISQVDEFNKVTGTLALK